MTDGSVRDGIVIIEKQKPRHLPFSTGHTARVLRFLVQHADKPITTKTLLKEIWGIDNPEASEVHYLENCVSHLRHLFGSEYFPRHSDDGYVFRPSRAEQPKLEDVAQRGARRVAKHQRGKASDVVFWHSFDDREADGKGVGHLIESAKRRIVITGGSLNTLAWDFIDQLQARLAKGVSVGIVMATPSPETLKTYVRYSEFLNATSPGTQLRYEKFCKSLSEEESTRFALCHTDIFLTHSIGLYDDQAFVSEFCIDRKSKDCPSFRSLAGSETYLLCLSEVRTLLQESRCVFGEGMATLLDNVTRELSRYRGGKK
jgi:hypothetical protein